MTGQSRNLFELDTKITEEAITVSTEEYNKEYNSSWKGWIKGLYGRVLEHGGDNNDSKDTVAGGSGC